LEFPALLYKLVAARVRPISSSVIRLQNKIQRWERYTNLKAAEIVGSLSQRASIPPRNRAS
jgi:hypothetical protein